MKGTTALRCAATGCWNPNELPQCIREDIYGEKFKFENCKKNWIYVNPQSG